jgi:fatty-acyl-CoA synthase
MSPAAEKARVAAIGAGAIVRSGMLRPESPRRFARAAKASRRWDRTLAGAVAVNAARSPYGICVIDDSGAVMHGEMHERTNRIANALADLGLGPGNRIGLLCRDSRHFIAATVAVSKLGADLLLMNTAFSGPQLMEVVTREGVVALIYDDEFSSLMDDAPDGLRRVVADGVGDGSLDALARAGSDLEPEPPASPGRQILLTSGTTGTPKGAKRPSSIGLDVILGYLSRVPYRARRSLFIASPMFHAWGFAHMGLGLMLGCEIVVRRRFDPEETLRVIDLHSVYCCALVPVMAQRVLALPPEVRERYDTSSLGAVVLGGSAIPGDLAVRFMDAFGDVAYNVYGSTEVAVVSVASPSDLRADPATAGKLLPGMTVRLLDDDDREVPAGSPGRIFAGGGAAFEGYTDGATKAFADGLMSTGDMGCFDESGRLSIVGRDDDMIVSGGENVFPSEVEDLIVGLDGVVEAAVLGAPDDEFGQRLRAFVVKADDASLSEEDVKAAVRSGLARFKVPRDVVFLDELPRTSTGKVLKRELSSR